MFVAKRWNMFAALTLSGISLIFVAKNHDFSAVGRILIASGSNSVNTSDGWITVPDGKLLPVGEGVPVFWITPFTKKAGQRYDVSFVVFPEPSTNAVFGADAP